MRLTLAALAPAFLSLAACGGETDPVNTEFEEEVPAPVADAPDGEPAPVNDTIGGGADEQVDEQYSGENMSGATDTMPAE